MNRLTNLTPAEKKFLDEAIAAAERGSGKKQKQPNRHTVLNRGGGPIGPRGPAAPPPPFRGGGGAPPAFAWSRPRAPRR